MATRDRRVDRALATWHRIRAATIADIRAARLAAGLSRADLGRAVGLSAHQIGRFERGEPDDLGIAMLCRLAAGVGLEASVRLFPDGDPVRDVGHLRLLERLRSRLPRSVGWRVEVPLPGGTGARAWDARIDPPSCREAVEAETRLGDLQAIERRALLKLHDDPSVRHLVLLVADPSANRRALELGREGLRTQFPIDTRQALIQLSAGRCPGANAIIVL